MVVFSKGQRIKTASGGELEIVDFLGAGGQGAVYKVNYCGEELALKWYHSNRLYDNERFYRNIEQNIRQGAPAECF